METTKLRVVERGYYCSFCDETTFAPDEAEGVLCRNCGLDTSNSGPDSPRRTLQTPDEPNEKSEIDGAGRSDARRRALIKAGVAVATLTCVTLAGVGVTNFIKATPAPSVATATPVTRISLAQANARHMTVDVEGYDATPAWAIAGEATQVIASDTGDVLLLVTPNDATVYYVETGDMRDRYAMSPGDTAQVAAVATSTGFVVKRHDTLSVWSDDIGWRHGDIDAKATLLSRGGIAVAVSPEKEYSLVKDDATLTSVTRPGNDATLITVTPTHVVWEEKRRVTVTARGDAAPGGRDVPLASDSDMKLDRVVGADEKHVYGLWRQGDTASLSSHDITTGDLVDSSPVTLGDDEHPFLSTHGETFHAYENVTIDALAGAITPVPNGQPMTIAAGEGFVTATETRATILHPKKQIVETITIPKGAAVTTISNRGLILNTPEGVIALTPTQKETKK